MVTFYFISSLAVILTGIDKTGFGGGIGIVVTPLLILVVPPKEALGLLLPILCMCDGFAIYHYRNSFHTKNLLYLLPGAVIGIALSGLFLGKIEEKSLKFWIGVLSIIFVGYRIGKTWILNELTAYRPRGWQGWLYGTGIGVTSTLAHAGGPLATMFLLPQNLGRQLFVGTTVILFAVVNAVKLIPYFYFHLINLDRLSTSLTLLPFVPVGTYLGVWMNGRLNEKIFNTVIYTTLFLVGVKFTTGFDLMGGLLKYFQGFA